MPENASSSVYAKVIAEASARHEAQQALNSALEEQASACAQFFKQLEASLGKEMKKANEDLAGAGITNLFEGLYVSTPPEYRMVISFGGAPHAREILLDLEDRNLPTIHIFDAKKSPTGTLHFALKNAGQGLRAFVTEGGGTANWGVSLLDKDVAVRIVENVIDGLFR